MSTTPFRAAELDRTSYPAWRDGILTVGTGMLPPRRYPGYLVETHAISSTTLNLQQQQAPLINVGVTDTLPQRAADAANAVAAAFIAYIKQVNNSKFSADLKALQHQVSKNQVKIDQLTNQIISYRGSTLGLDNLKFTPDELAEIDRYATEADINLWAASSAK